MVWTNLRCGKKKTITRVCSSHPLSCSSRSSWKRLPKPGSLIWTRESTLCPLTSPVMVFPSSDLPFQAKLSWSLFQVQVSLFQVQVSDRKCWDHSSGSRPVQTSTLCPSVSSCLAFPNALLTCLSPEDTAKEYSGVKEQLSVIYITLNFSLILRSICSKASPVSWEGHILEISI